jgi:hypothetical protein
MWVKVKSFRIDGGNDDLGLMQPSLASALLSTLPPA